MQDLILDRHVERRRRLVAEQQLRARRRARSRSRCAGAGRPRARAGRRGSGAPGRGCRPGAAARAPASRASPALCPRRTRGPSAIWSPTRMTGLSAVIGSWKTMPMLSAHAQPSERARRERVAVEHDLAAGDRAPAAAAGRGSRAASCSCRSPTRRRARARRRAATSKLTPSTALTRRAAAGSRRAGRAREDRLGAHSGASRSARPSPSRERPRPGEHDRDARERGELPLRGDQGLAVGDHRAPVGGGRRDARPEVAERDDREHRQHDVAHREDDRLRDHVRQQVAER